MDFPGSSVVKNLPASADIGWIPGVGKVPRRRKWQVTPEFLPGKFHGQRSQAGHSPWGHKRVGHNLVNKQQYFNMSQYEINKSHLSYQSSLAAYFKSNSEFHYQLSYTMDEFCSKQVKKYKLQKLPSSFITINTKWRKSQKDKYDMRSFICEI